MPAQIASADDQAPLTLTDPEASGLSVDVTPADLSTVRQGDVVQLRFSGLEAGEYVYSLGTCPSDLPVENMDAETYVGQLACASRIPTGLSGDTDPTSLNTPGLSTSTFLAFPRGNGTVDIDYLVGSGSSVGTLGYQIVLANGDRESHPSLTCDADSACTIGFVVQRKDGSSNWRDLTSLVIRPPDASGDTTGCSGLSATSTISAGGPERLQDPMAALDREFCAQQASPIPVSYVPTAAGENDPAGVAGVGTSADLAFAGSPTLARHKLAAGQMAVPIALHAVAVAQMGASTTPSLTPGMLAYNGEDPGGLALSASDVARIVLHDFPTSIPGELPTTPAQGRAYNPLAGDLLSRPGNAAALERFDPSLIGLPFVMAPTVTYSVGVDSTAIALSSYLTTAAASSWTFPSNAVNDDLERSGDAVGRIEAFAPLVDNSTVVTGTVLTSQTSSVGGLYSAKTSKDITSGPWANTCPLYAGAASLPPYQAALTKGCLRFAVMDTSTAATIGLTSARLAAGTAYVAPTSSTMQAAAQDELNADGYFPATGAGAYPLTFVEYAVVPKAPLLDDSCRTRAQQSMLTAFLTYVTGPGQATLAPGLVPLTQDLAAEAAAAIAKIGKGTPTGACAPRPTATPNPTTATTTTRARSEVAARSNSSTGLPNVAGPTVAPLPAAGQATAPAAAASDTTALPSARPVAAFKATTFTGAAPTSTTTVAIGLVLLAAILAAAAYLASIGKSPLDLLAMIRRGRR